jgi:hypothetical protein
MGKLIKEVIHNNIWIKIFSITSIVLMVTSFFLPPMGTIDSSVLGGVGELFAWAALWAFIHAIDNGKDAKVKHNDTEITVGDIND